MKTRCYGRCLYIRALPIRETEQKQSHCLFAMSVCLYGAKGNASIDRKKKKTIYTHCSVVNDNDHTVNGVAQRKKNICHSHGNKHKNGDFLNFTLKILHIFHFGPLFFNLNFLSHFQSIRISLLCTVFVRFVFAIAVWWTFNSCYAWECFRILTQLAKCVLVVRNDSSTWGKISSFY